MEGRKERGKRKEEGKLNNQASTTLQAKHMTLALDLLPVPPMYISDRPDRLNFIEPNIKRTFLVMTTYICFLSRLQSRVSGCCGSPRSHRLKWKLTKWQHQTL